MRELKAAAVPANSPQLVISNPSLMGLGTSAYEDRLFNDDLKSMSESDVSDFYGELDRRCDAHKRIENRRKEFKDHIEKLRETHAADKPTTMEGRTYRLEITPKKMERAITNRSKLRKILTALGLFNDAWQVAFGLIDKKIPEEQHGLFLSKARTGHRDINPVLKEKAQVVDLSKAA